MSGRSISTAFTAKRVAMLQFYSPSVMVQCISRAALDGKDTAIWRRSTYYPNVKEHERKHADRLIKGILERDGFGVKETTDGTLVIDWKQFVVPMLPGQQPCKWPPTFRSSFHSSDAASK